MEFAILGTCCGCRLGLMTVAGHSKQIATPMCLLYTRSGSLPHISRDVLSKLNANVPPVLQMPVGHWAEWNEVLAEYKLGVKKFTALEDYLVYCSIQDSTEEVFGNHNDKASVAVWGKAGKIKLDSALYTKTCEAMQPDIIEALADCETDGNTTNKRLQKSVARSLSFLDEFIEFCSKSEVLKGVPVFGVVVGGHSEDHRLRSARETRQRDVAGFSIDGLQKRGLSMEKFVLKDLTDVITKTLAELPADKPRLLPGILTPVNILTAIELGFDIVDSTYPYVVTERGCALVFDYTLPQSKPHSDSASCQTVEEPRPVELDLNHSSHAASLIPISSTCVCYTCRTHTRAYINHLLNTSEILGSVLLMLHNLHHFFSFFEAIRDSIRTERYEEFAAHIRSHQ